MEPVTIAAVQATPVFLDRSATLAEVQRRTAEAASAGAGLVVFPEAFIPGYPDWVWRRKPWDDGASDWFRRLHDEAIEVDGAGGAELAEIARAHGVYLVVGVNERAGGTLYNALLQYTPTGDLAVHHRKLVPTGGERLVWGQGDGFGLRTHPTPFGRVGGLICWENYMPLARAALYGQGIDIYLAPTWDNSDSWMSTLRHIAKEGRCYVVGVTPLLRGSDIPESIPGRDELYGGEDDWLSQGNTAIVEPGGRVVAGPLTGTAGIVTATTDPAVLVRQRQQFDPSGHYARNDVLALRVDQRRRHPVTITDDGPGDAARDED